MEMKIKPRLLFVGWDELPDLLKKELKNIDHNFMYTCARTAKDAIHQIISSGMYGRPINFMVFSSSFVSSKPEIANFLVENHKECINGDVSLVISMQNKSNNLNVGSIDNYVESEDWKKLTKLIQKKVKT